MGQYDDRVEKQRLLLEAEEWATGIQSIHTHSISSMWYDTFPEDTANGKRVTDTEFNSGLIKRNFDEGKVRYFGKALKGDALIDKFLQINDN